MQLSNQTQTKQMQPAPWYVFDNIQPHQQKYIYRLLANKSNKSNALIACTEQAKRIKSKPL